MTRTLLQQEAGDESSSSSATTKKWYSSIFTDSSLPASSFNFINSIIGSGVIGMPFAFAQSGIIITFALFVLIFLLTDYSLLILILSGNKMGAKSYQELVHMVLGRWGYVVLSILQFSYPFISLISYNIIIGDTITKVSVRLFNVSTNSLLSNRIFVVCMVSLFVTLPLCLLKKISKLSKTSFVSCILLIFVTIVMLIRLFTQKNKFEINYENMYSAKTNVLDISNSFAIMAFAFMTHHNSFLIYNSLENPTYSNWKKVTHSSVFGSILFCILFGLIGYLSFGSATQGDIFESYCFKDDIINIARFSYVIIIMFSFPLEGVVCREVLKHLVSHFGYEEFFHWIFAIMVVSVSALISFINDCLGSVLEINGSITAIAMAYILPPMCITTIMYKHENKRKLRSYVTPALVFLIGLFFVISGVVSTSKQLVRGFSCSHGVEPAYCKDLYASRLLHNGTNDRRTLFFF